MTIEEIKILIDSAVYLLCPGYITIVVWDILRGKKTQEGKALFIKSIVTSSIYYYLFAWINGLEIKPSKMVDIKLYDYTIIILLSVFVPYVINKIISSPKLENFLVKLGIFTSLYDTVLKHYLKIGNEGAYAFLYLDDEQVAYRGLVVSYDDERIEISNVTRYICTVAGIYEKDSDYVINKEIDRTVILEFKRISRMEFERKKI